MKITSNLKGQIAIAKVELRALSLGYIPSIPTFDTRYDLILDKNGTLTRCQVKYGDGKMSNSDGSVRVKLEYKDRQNNSYFYTDREVDALIVYLPKIDQLCYFLPETFVGKASLCIRIRKSKNNQEKGVLLAENHLW